jgi:2-dehydropantoate 2-reductase
VAIVVVGAGAIGLLIAGRLAQSPAPVVLLARPSVATAIANQHLRIAQDGVLSVVRGLSVITDPAELARRGDRPELAILCVKSYDTLGALPALEALHPHSILALQNGIGNEEILAERFGAERIISGAITTSVEVAEPGRVAVTKSGGIGLARMCQEALVDHRASGYVGPSEAGQQFGRAISALLAAGFRVHTYTDYRSMKWSKALLNMLGNATAAILDMSVEAIYADRRLVALERRAFLEALHVMDRLGIRPVNLPRYPAALLALAMRWAPPALLDPLLRRMIAGGRGGKPPSLQIDLARGVQRSEGEFLYGAVARAAERAGTAAPVNRALWETLRAIVGGTIPPDRYRRQPEQLLARVKDMEECLCPQHK